MKLIKKLGMSALTLVILCGSFTDQVFAKEVEQKQKINTLTKSDAVVAEFIGDPYYDPISGKEIRGIFADYKVTADKSTESRGCKCSGIGVGTDFRCNGWVKVVHKKSGTGLKHSTTAALSSLVTGSMYKGAVKEIGTGKVSAKSKWVHGWDVPRIFWDWVK